MCQYLYLNFQTAISRPRGAVRVDIRRLQQQQKKIHRAISLSRDNGKNYLCLRIVLRSIVVEIQLNLIYLNEIDSLTLL